MNQRPTAVITGASSGIGAAVAIALIESGWNVCLLARSLDKMKEITSKYNNNNQIKLIKCDVSKPTEIISSCKDIISWSNNNVNLLFNNVGVNVAAMSGNADVETTSLDHWDYIMNVNLRSAFLFTQKLLSPLKYASSNPCKYNNNIYDGCIVNNSSATSKDPSIYKHATAYSVSKTGLNQLTKLNALELSKYKIRVNCILPGFIPTLLITDYLDTLNENQKKEFEDGYLKMHPIGRLGSTDDIIQIIKFLSNKKQSGWITGQLISLDGGWLLHGAASLL